MTDTLDWVYWLRAVWEARGEAQRDGFLRPERVIESAHAIEFLTLWLTDLMHIGRVYEAD